MTLLRHCDGPDCDRIARNNGDWLEVRTAATDTTEDYCSARCLIRKHAQPNLTIGPSL